MAEPPGSGGRIRRALSRPAHLQDYLTEEETKELSPKKAPHRRSKPPPGPIGIGADGEPVYAVSKVLNVRSRDGAEEALVSFEGWSSEYDEWLPLNFLSEQVRDSGGRKGESQRGRTVQ